MIGMGGRIRKASVEDDQLGTTLLALHHSLGMRVEVMPGLEMGTNQENHVSVGVIGAGAINAAPQLVAGSRPRGADVGMRVVTVHAPGGENALGEAILAGTADMVHDLVVALLIDRLADASRDIVQSFHPTRPGPTSPRRADRPV